MFHTVKEARLEAVQCRDEQSYLNLADSHGSCFEYAYSPAHFTVGIRNTDALDNADGNFRIFNINYPMYGRDDEVTDWVSVGKETHLPVPVFGVKLRHRSDIPNQSGFTLIALLTSGKLQLTTVLKGEDDCHYLAGIDIVEVLGWYTAEEIRKQFGLGASLKDFNCENCGEHKSTLPHCVFCVTAK